MELFVLHPHADVIACGYAIILRELWNHLFYLPKRPETEHQPSLVLNRILHRDARVRWLAE
jgi:hypothetical protein